MWPRRELFTAAERDTLIEAIRGAERGNRGEVRLHVEARCKGDALVRAEQLFSELCQETRGETGVLLYVAPSSRKVAVWAGEGIHGAAAPTFWRSVTDAVAAGFATGDRVGGLARALDEIGVLLRAHVPGDDTAGNELPDQVTTS